MALGDISTTVVVAWGDYAINKAMNQILAYDFHIGGLPAIESACRNIATLALDLKVAKKFC